MNIEKFIDEYLDFLKENLTIKKLKDIHEITLHFFEMNNDALTIYVDQISEDEYRVSDDSYIINNLYDNGINLSKKRLDSISSICLKLGVEVEANELLVYSKSKNLVSKVHTLAQAMLRVDDMYLTSQNRVSSYFIEDLINFFDQNEIYYSRDISFIGKTGMTHSFDFLFQRSKENPERICRAINNGSKNNMINVLFAWQDIETIRNNKSKLIIIVNDNNKIEDGVIEGFNNYDIKSYRWSELSSNLTYFN